MISASAWSRRPRRRVDVARAQARADAAADRRREPGRPALGAGAQRLAGGPAVHVGADRVLPGPGARGAIRRGVGRRHARGRDLAGRILCRVRVARVPLVVVGGRRVRLGRLRDRHPRAPRRADARAGADDHRRDHARRRDSIAADDAADPRGDATAAALGPARAHDPRDGHRAAPDRRRAGARAAPHRAALAVSRVRRDSHDLRAPPRRRRRSHGRAAWPAARALRVLAVLPLTRDAAGARRSPRRVRRRHGGRAGDAGRDAVAASAYLPAMSTLTETFTTDLIAAGLDAPWLQPGPLIRPKASAMKARLWRWRDIEPLVRRTPEFMKPGRGAERRILRLDNPGVPERTAGHTISIAVQYLMPGETAPAHRHTPNAVRFMLHGEGAYTTIEGDKCVMRRGDLVVTPSMTWHDHGNEGTEPVMWTDGLDSPVVRYLENLMMDPYEGETQPVRTGPPARHLHYRWETAYAELVRRSTGAADPFDDILMEYVD